MSALNCVITINRDHDLHTKRNDVRAGRSLWVQCYTIMCKCWAWPLPCLQSNAFGHIHISSKNHLGCSKIYFAHCSWKITISAHYNYLQVSHFLVKLEPVFLLLLPWQVKPNWAAPTVGPTPASNRHTRHKAQGTRHKAQGTRHLAEDTHLQPLAFSESDLIKIIISIWPRGHIFN